MARQPRPPDLQVSPTGLWSTFSSRPQVERHWSSGRMLRCSPPSSPTSACGPSCSRRSTAPRLRGADADPARGDPAAARRAATCSARRPPAPARRRRSRCRCCSGSPPATAARGRRRWCWCRPASWRCRCREAVAPLRPRPRRPGAADLRRPADRPPAAARSQRGVDVVVATPGRALDHLGRGTLTLDDARGRSCSTRPTRCSTWASPRTSRRSSTATPAERQTVLFSATMPPRIDGIARRHLTRPGADRRSPREPAAAGRGAAGAPDRLRRRPRAQARRARPGPRRRGADRGDRLLPHPRRGRPAHRDPERPRLPGRGAARRHEPGAARPGDGPAARPAPPTCWSPPTSPPAGWTSTTSPTSSTTTCPSAPEAYVHRIGRVGRAGREGVAITLAEPREHRMLKTIERVTGQRDHRSRRCRPSPTCGPGGWS